MNSPTIMEIRYAHSFLKFLIPLLLCSLMHENVEKKISKFCFWFLISKQARDKKYVLVKIVGK